MRKVIAYFIKYPVAVNVIMAAFVIFGFIGLRSLKSSYFPLTDSKIITISAIYPGASPLEIEEGVVLKIEDNLKGLVGIDRVTSVSRESSASVMVEIEKGRDINIILAEVKNAVDRVPSFPTGMEPLVVEKTETIRETIDFAISGKNVPLKTLKAIGRNIENDLRAIDGISQVEISGFPDEEIEIAVRENDLLAYGITFQEVSQAISRENILVTGGNIKTVQEEYLIRANGRSYNAKDLDKLIVRSNPNGKIIRLREIADVRDRFSETPNASYFNGSLAVNVAVSNTNDEDLVTSAEKIKEYIENFNATNENVHLDVLSDASITLNQRTELLAANAGIGMLLVLIFLSLFLNTRLAFWVAAGLPIAFLGMFVFAGFFNVTINVLSLFGMIIVIGILVDDGIVIAENIYDHFQKGKSKVDAALDGTMEVLPPIVSAIITTLLAFGTFLFLDSRIGEFFGEVSVIVILTLTVSLVEALIILPSHLAHSKALEVQDTSVKKKGLALVFSKLRDINKIGDKIINFLKSKIYLPVLRFGLNYKFLMASFFIGMLLLTIGAIRGSIIRTTFFPNIASDRIRVTLKMEEGTNVAITDSILSMIEAKAWMINKEFTEKMGTGDEVYENIVKNIGPGTANGSLVINLLPGEKRTFGATEIGNAIRDAVGPVYGTETLTFGSGGNFGGSPVSVSLLGNNINELKSAKEELKAAMTKNPILKDITDNDPKGIKEIKIKLKQSAFPMGLNTQDVMSQVRSAFFGFQAQRFQRGQDEIKVWVRYDLKDRSSINNLDKMKILTPNGDRVPFREIADYSIERGEIAINHLEGRREIQVSADLKDPKASATDILQELKTVDIPVILGKYPSVTALYEGQNRESDKLAKSASLIIPIVLFLMYATIAFTFRSYGQPFLLLLMIPVSLIGIAFGHWIHDFPINILSLLGIIALIGIMVNDGLVLIGKFNSFLKEGMPFDIALVEAGSSRFRAIFLTSLTTIAGLAPLILEKSRQAQFLIPMAISIAYGIAIATILTLLFLPILLSASNSLKVSIKWLRTGKEVTKEEVERAVKEQAYEGHSSLTSDKRIIVGVFFIAMFVFSNGNAQRILTKEKAVQMALEQNFNIKIAQNNIEIAEANASKDNLGFKPTITATGGANYNLDNSKAIFQDGRETTLNFAGSNSANAGLSLNYVLFDGFNRQYNLERNQQSFTASQLTARFALENVLSQLFAAYYEVARIEADFENLEEILAISKERLERVKVSYDYGAATLLDVSNAEVDINTDSIALLNQNQLLANAKHNLNFILNTEVLTDFDVVTDVIFAAQLDKEELIEGLRNANVDLLLAASDIKLSEIDQKLVSTSRMPTVSFNSDYGINRSVNNKASFLDRANSNGLTGNLSVNWAIFDGGRRRVQEQNAKITQMNQHLNFDLTHQQVLRDFENAWSDYQNRLVIWKALEQNVITNRLNFERSEERYRLRQITNIDFRQAQSNLINALNAQNRAKFNAKLSELQVFSIAGKIQDAVY